MNPFAIAKSAKNALSKFETNFNRLAGRELVPVQTKILNIETSSLCNLECVFCAYAKKSSPKVAMKDAFFKDCIEQAARMGYTHFELSPMTGDVFMDRHIFNKFDFLDNHSAVEGYHFFTNFTLPDQDDIVRLVGLKKLKNLTVSIYGHDLASFIAITRSTEKVYSRLRSNLLSLLASMSEKKFNLDIVIRTTRDAPRQPTSDVMKLLERFRERGVHTRSSHVYNNWGGYITQADVQGMAIDVTGTESTYKHGACSLLFTDYQIMATGIVNGCAARDVDASLKIGDLNEMPLNMILSPENPAYMRLIEEQQRGEFRPACKSCDYYKSIYHMRKRHSKDGTKYQTIEAFKDRLREAGRPRSDDLMKELAQATAGAPQSNAVSEDAFVPAK
jgi:sulfatase maturation enzyme AslB (radical SAM superfamily)